MPFQVVARHAAISVRTRSDGTDPSRPLSSTSRHRRPAFHPPTVSRCLLRFFFDFCQPLFSRPLRFCAIVPPHSSPARQAPSSASALHAARAADMSFPRVQQPPNLIHFSAGARPRQQAAKRQVKACGDVRDAIAPRPDTPAAPRTIFSWRGKDARSAGK